MLTKTKLNSTKTQALIDLEISHEEFVTIWKERDKYGKMKENFINVIESMRLNSVNPKKSKNERKKEITSL